MPHKGLQGGGCNYDGGDDEIVYCGGEARYAIDNDERDGAVAAVKAIVLEAVRHHHPQGSLATHNASTVAISQQPPQTTTSTTKILLQIAAQGNDNDENGGSPL